MKDNKDCPVSVAQKVIGGKWTILILYQLSIGTCSCFKRTWTVG